MRKKKFLIIMGVIILMIFFLILFVDDADYDCGADYDCALEKYGKYPLNNNLESVSRI